MTSPSDVPQPFSNAKGQYNIKPREVKCYKCNYTVVTDLADPQCSVCHSRLIVVYKPHELVTPDS